MSAKWLTVKNEANQPAEIIISGFIGESFWDDSGNSAKDFRNALNSIPRGRKVTVKINSEGGVIKDALEMYDAIRARREDVTAEIVGYACSAASWLALSAGKVVTSANALWMIHESSSFTGGNKRDHAKSAEMLGRHDDSIAGIYAQHTGKSTKDILSAMEAETWLTGKEAVDYGLASEVIEAPANATAVAVNAAPLNREHVKNTLAAAAKGAKQQPATEPSSPTAANVTATPPVTAQAAQISTGNVADGGDGTAAAITENKEAVAIAAPANTQEQKMETQVPVAATPPTIPADNSALLDKVSALELEVNALKAQPINARPQVVVVGDAHDKMIELPHGNERRNHIINGWSDIRRAMETKKVVNDNTISATLTTALLSTTSYTVLQNKLAALQALFLQVEADRQKPLAKVEVPKTTAGATAQTDPTDWESGNSTVTNTEITLHEYSVSFSLSNAQLQNGTQMGWYTYINAVQFANKIIDVLLTPVTVANYGAASLTSAAATFGPADLATVLADAKNFNQKNLVLDGAYTARLTANSSLGLGWNNNGAGYGFDKIVESNRWSAAGANVVGFVADPLSLVAAAALPIDPPGGNAAFNSLETTTIPMINFPVQVASWIKPGTRVLWMAYDALFGVQTGDTNGLKLIASA